MKEMRALLNLVKGILVLVAVVTLISGILVIIAAVQNVDSASGLIAKLGDVKIHGLIGIEECSKELINKMLIVLGVFCFAEAIASFSLNKCVEKVLKSQNFFSMENSKRTRNIGIIVAVVFVVLTSLLSFICGYNDIAEEEYLYNVMRTVSSACELTIGIGIVFVITSIFFKAGAETLEKK